jgi:methionyl-tRNA formyltransferase
MTQRIDCSILFLGKKGDEHCSQALGFVRRNVAGVAAHLGEWGDPLPEEAASWEGDYIISYLSRWVVPEYLINKARIASINFHPASPQYPGIGCNNFALYEDAKEYGVTCHHMAARVDTGDIIAVKRFPVFPSDDVGSLLIRTYDYQLVLFYEIAGTIVQGHPLPSSKETWTRKPFTRTEFNELAVIRPEMSSEEVRKRVRATSFGVYQPTVEIAGHLFQFKADEDG